MDRGDHPVAGRVDAAHGAVAAVGDPDRRPVDRDRAGGLADPDAGLDMAR
jgi:hypothetical protein